MSDKYLVYAVVLAWNHIDVTLECLESLSMSTYPNLRIVVVDNGSNDNTSVEAVRHYSNIEVVRIIDNVGIARGYNQGINFALEHNADYVIALNNDTIVAPEMITELVKAIQSHPKAGIVSPKIYHFYGDKTRLWCAGAKWQRFPPCIKLIGSNASDSVRFCQEFKLSYVTSCCILISRDALEKVGLFDPAYYFYYDDWDLSERYLASGYEIWFIPTAHIWHKVSVSTLKTEKPKKWWFVMGRSSVRFYLLYKSKLIFMLYVIWFVFRESFKLKLFNHAFPFLCGVGEGLADWFEWN